jgi:hypothetical protein
MNRARISALFLVILAGFFAGALVQAQTGQNLSAAQPNSPRVVEADQLHLPFAIDSKTPETAATIELRLFDRMTQQDRDLAVDAEPTISERARFAGMDLAQGKWNYQQIVCPALPGHLFLRYTRNSGIGDVSMFTASVPRGSSGQVYVIPILRRGYSLFSPAPLNSLTIAVFNRIRAEESPDTPPGWLGTGLCYAALAGAHPQLALVDESKKGEVPSVPPGTLQISAQGSAVISFMDVAAASRPMEWTMTFDSKGKLLKARRSRAPQWKEKVVRQTPAEVQGKPIQSTDVDGKALLTK